MEQKEVLLLLPRIRQGESEAFALLTDRFDGMMQKLVRAFSVGRCEADSAELLQEARLALYRAACTYRDAGGVTFGLYAHICIQNKLIDMYRRRDSLPDVIEDADVELISDDSELEASIITRETVDAVLRAADRILSDYERRVLALHMQGYKTAMIAKALSRDAKSVDNAKSRIFRRLRGVIDK